MNVLRDAQKDPRVAIVELRVITRFSSTLSKFQNVYPPSEITNILMELFELLNFYTPQFTSEDRYLIGEAASGMLDNFEKMRQGINACLESDTVIPSEDKERIKEILNL